MAVAEYDNRPTQLMDLETMDITEVDNPPVNYYGGRVIQMADTFLVVARGKIYRYKMALRNQFMLSVKFLLQF